MSHRFYPVVIISLAVLLAIPCYAELVPMRGQVDSRVRVVPYSPNDVIRLRGYVGYQIHMQFAPGEEFVNFGAGDAWGLEVGPVQNNLMIKPKQEKVGTNLTIVTNRRVYQFDYSAVKKIPDPKVDDVIYSIRFIYPEEEAKQSAAELERKKSSAQLAGNDSTLPRNNNYWFCGSTSIRPVSAYDNGVQTRVKFGAKSEFPAIFVKNDDNTESLLNFNIENDEVVIHRVSRQFILRRGGLVGCIQNRSFDGGGTRLNSGTVVPGVERDTIGEGAHE